MNQIENLLRQAMGLHTATVGSALVEQTVLARMRSRGLVKLADYEELLRGSPAEWNHPRRNAGRGGDVVLSRPDSVRRNGPIGPGGMAAEPSVRRIAAPEHAVFLGRGTIFDGHGVAGRGAARRAIPH